MIANWTTTRKHVITILLSNLFSIFFIYFKTPIDFSS